jgi:hypothetical protein
MDFSVCAQCGAEIESKGIHFRNHVFCSDECCEEYEAEFADKDEPVIGELLDDGHDPEDIDENDLGYREDGLDESLDDNDDDFDIKLEDF